MKKVGEIIQKKPATLTLIVVVYLITTSLLKWRLRPPVEALWYLAGGGIGMYFLDVSEEFFHLVPSPFRTMVFFSLFVLVSFFVTTSSGNILASGLVFSVYICLLTSLVGEFFHRGNIQSWFRMTDTLPSREVQRISMLVFFLAFFVQVYLFVK
jgi:hypothetical protein